MYVDDGLPYEMAVEFVIMIVIRIISRLLRDPFLTIQFAVGLLLMSNLP